MEYKRTLKILGAFLLCAVSISAAEKSETIKKQFVLGDGGRITVVADEGEILVTGSTGDKVEVKAVKTVWGKSNKAAEERLEMLDVEFRKTGNRLVIRAIDRIEEQFSLGDILDGDFWRSKGWQDDRIDFELKVPANLSLKLKSDEGDVVVSDTKGDLRIEVDEGDISLEALEAEELKIAVDEGNVRMEDVKSDGFCEIHGDEGAVRVKNTNFEGLNINVDEGRILFDSVAAKDVNIATDEGDMAIQLITQDDGRYRLSADEGYMEIGLLPDSGCEVQLRTDEGEIQSDFELKKRRLDDGEKMSGVVGKGNKSVLQAYTEEGDIILRRFQKEK